MDIALKDGGRLQNQSPISMCTGYKANFLVMRKEDIEALRSLSYRDPKQFNSVMIQLEGRFK